MLHNLCFLTVIVPTAVVSRYNRTLLVISFICS